METLNSVNNLLKGSCSALWSGVSSVWSYGPVDSRSKMSSASKAAQMLSRREVLMALQSSPWTRLAGLMGASAVAMGAYGAHALNPKPDIPVEYKSVYETANKYHFFHSLALLAVPLTRRPLIVGSLMVSGMFVFCGTCYIYSLTHNKEIIRYTPFGGLTLILAWLAMLL